ncbi:MAG TPA: SDR family oxidoreductase [Methylophilaceae bacterium]|nr:SDR family oxidoreductase [Methylophilaceae bacterium]
MAISHKPIEEQVIVVTGATSGIGLATALLAAQRGARLVLIARSEDILKALVEQIKEIGSEAIYIVADVGDYDSMNKAAQAAVQHFGCIDTWVNNAGVSIYSRLEETEEADSRRLFETNFWGVVNGSRAALPYLKASGGALINVGSEVSDAVIPLQGMYSASKHAVKGYTDALRVELEDVEDAPISITLIQPTAVNTPFPQHAKNYMDKEPKLPTPMIEPVQVAEAILKAATSGGRDVKVGAMAVVNTAVSKLLPSLGDKISARQANRQQEDFPPRDPEGTLYKPGHDGRIHGHAPT